MSEAASRDLRDANVHTSLLSLLACGVNAGIVCWLRGAAVTLNLAADGMPPPSGAMNGSEHQRQLTAVRGLAAFQVVVFHAGHFNGEWAVFFTACN